MSETHPAHVKADYISKHVPEIASLYRSLAIKSYFDGKYLSFFLEPPEGYDPQRPIDPDINGKKGQIDGILWNLAYNELDNSPDTKAFKDAAIELAQQYPVPDRRASVSVQLKDEGSPKVLRRSRR